MSRRRTSGFTLLEILLAVALLAALLMALNTFIFSMGEIWGRNSDKRLFDQHVRAVTRYVGTLLRNAALSPVALAGTDNPIAPQEVRTETGGDEPMLTFELPEGDRTMPWPAGPLPDVVCSLAARDGKGLVLYWHSRLEKRFTDDPPRATVLTPFVTTMTYDYYQPDLKSWQNQPRLDKDNDGKYRTPDRVTLKFVHGDMTAETSVAVPVTAGGLPPF